MKRSPGGVRPKAFRLDLGARPAPFSASARPGGLPDGGRAPRLRLGGAAWWSLFLVLQGCGSASEEDGGVRFKDARITIEDAEPADGGIDEDAAEPLDLGPPDNGVPEVDRDQDGIPDLEDPNPTRANLKIFSDYFEDTQGGWIFSSVSMAIRPELGLLRVERVEPFEREGWIGPRPSWSTYYVRSRIRLGRVGTASDNLSGHAGLIVMVNQVTPSRYLTCGLDKTNQRAVLSEHEGNQRRTLAEAPLVGALDNWMRLDFITQNGNHQCFVGEVRLEGNSNLFVAGAIGFRSYDATFDADFVEVYELN
ncbi:MAG: hypothetical protein IPG45_06965 [Deltaproteobacteria bacterium]|nr:hypothetical protein [Deltaproteobacteria bacterium]